MFERFTDQARRVVVLAQEEARLLNHGYIGSEHVLLGVLAEAHGAGARALVSLGVTIDTARGKVIALVGRGERAPSGHIPFTPQAKRALEGALREAMHVGDHEIGAEHLLLGLIREGDSTAARALEELDIDLDALRERVVQIRLGTGPASGARSLPLDPSRGMPVGGTPLPGGAGVCSFCGRDLWEVDRYVTGSHAAICDACLVGARDALADAPAGSRAVPLPPRVFGEVPDEGAVAAVIYAVCAAFDPDAADDARVDAIEGGAALAWALTRLKERYPDAAGRLDRIRFDSPDVAEVRFTVSVGGGVGPAIEGRVHRGDDGWRVSRELVESVLRVAGVHVQALKGREGPETTSP